MTYCAHCGLPPTTGCSDHVQTVQRRQIRAATKVQRDPKDEQSIHPRVRNGRTVSPKVDTSRPKRTK